MSAIPIIAPLSKPAPAPSPAPRSSAEPRADSAAFDAHLHDVQRRQSSTSAAADARTSSDQSSPGKTASVSANADGATAAATTTDDDNADGAVPAATQVLGLIQQSSGNTVAAAANGSDGKPAVGKAASPSDDAKPAPPAGVGMAMPPLVCANPVVTSPSDGSANAAAASLSLSTTASLSARAPGNAVGAFAAADDAETASAEDAGDDDGSTAVLAPGTDASAPTAVNALFGNAHNALAATADAAAPATGSVQDAGDLATLRGVLVTPAFVAPAPSSATPHALTIAANVTSPGFSQELGQQISWLGGQEIKQAQIRLNPQALGPLDVKVSIEHGRVDIVFAAQHPATVTAVQQSLTQLHQMLGGHGLSLGQATVGQHAAQQQSSHSQKQASSTPAQANDAEPIDATVSPVSAPLAIGLVDAFA